MIEQAGLLDHERLESIEGELISKVGKKRPHVHAAARLTGWLIQVFGDWLVNATGSIDVAPEDNPISEPQPDSIVLKPTFTDFFSATPQPSDLDLVVEVSDTSLPFDLTVKASLYARAGISEYWVLDVTGRRLLVHREPQSGSYRSVVSDGETESVAPLAAPDSNLPIGRIFELRRP